MGRRIKETSRDRRKRNPRPILVIVCEGTKTEPQYFRHFRSRYVNIQIEVEGNKSSGAKTDYHHLIEKSIIKKKEYITDTEGEGYIWCVFDTDVDYNIPDSASAKNRKLRQAVQKADEDNIKIALSNPCFELWFLLHFEFTTKSFKNYNDIKKHLIVNLPGYEKNADVYDELVDKLKIAIDNAKKLRSYHDKIGVTNFMDVNVTPYTNVWELIEEIQKLNQMTS